LRLAITHRYDFGRDAGILPGGLAEAEGWDALRTASNGPFALPDSRPDWEARADDPQLRERARALNARLGGRGVRALASYGVGTAGLELWLVRLDPGLRIVVTEFAPATAERLAALFTEVEVRRHDLRVDPPVVGADLHLLYRVDTELTDETFRSLLGRFGDVPLLVVATELLTPRSLLREVRTRIRGGATRAGLVRSRGAFESLFGETHELQRLRVHDLHGWLLEPR